MPRRFFPVLLPLILGLLLIAPAAADSIDDQLRIIAASGPNGAGAEAAKQAAAELAKEDVKILPRLLQAMDTDNFVAANWLRTIFETIVRREAQKPQPQFPIDSLKGFIRDQKHQGRSRRLVLRLLERLEPGFREPFLAAALDDPEFRHDAIGIALTQGDEFKQEEKLEQAAEKYEAAFNSARESGQIQEAASRLKSIGREVSIIDHMGFVIDWFLVGPFDAPDRTGFDLSFPPEEAVDLKAVYSGQGGTEISWKRYRTDDKLGLLNLVQAITPATEAVGYAYTELISPTEQDAEIRCGADDNLTVWLNGEKVLARRQWLNGTRLDRFTAPVRLKKGKNRLLVKICQGPQHKNPAVPNNWSMQLRICDAEGAAVGVQSALPPMESNNSSEPKN